MLTGKGFYIWNIKETEGGDPDSLASAAKKAGLGHALVKICDGRVAVNVETGGSPGKPPSEPPLLERVIAALEAAGVEVWGWGYVYGDFPEAEADIAIRRVKELGLKGFVIDAETEYKHKSSQAVKYVNRLRAGLPGVGLALSSFRFPSLHREFPWHEFLYRVDLNMPQVYWIGASNAGAQLRRCVAEFKSYPARPILPTGAAYKDNTFVDPASGEYWEPTADQVQEFMETAVELGMDGFNFWEWRNTRKFCPELWEVIADFVIGDQANGNQDEDEGGDSETGGSDDDTSPGPNEPVTRDVIELKPTDEVESWLNVRNGPGTQFGIVERIKPDEKVWQLDSLITADGSTWVRVGHRQWAAKRWVNPASGKIIDFLRSDQ